MKVVLTGDRISVGDAPVGLLYLTDCQEIICKSEYVLNGACECVIVSSGENYCGGDDQICIPIEFVLGSVPIRQAEQDLKDLSDRVWAYMLEVFGDPGDFPQWVHDYARNEGE